MVAFFTYCVRSNECSASMLGCPYRIARSYYSSMHPGSKRPPAKVQRAEVIGSKKDTRLNSQRPKSYYWQQSCERHMNKYHSSLRSSTHSKIFHTAPKPRVRMVNLFQISHSAASPSRSGSDEGGLKIKAVTAERTGICNVMHTPCAEMHVLACRRASTHHSPSAASPSTSARSCLFQAPIPSFNT